MGGYSDEFPLLAAYNLYPAEIRGDGNCLFNALSDQIYGHQDEHHKIRARVIEYMREHASYYKQFIDVQPGGGTRRNPKRKNAGAYSTPTNFTPPTAEEIDRVFESHMGAMARGGTYGDNMEITAFTAAFGIDVKIYQQDFAYMISAPENVPKNGVAYIAYHTWEHYSSIRNINGPHTGLPQVHERVLTPEEEIKQKAVAAKAPRVQPWQINVVLSSLPYLADREVIKKTLEEYKGNIDAAVSALLDEADRASVSSQQGSSSTERDQDSDDEEFSGPNKKQDRRMSRATKALRKTKAEKEAQDAVDSSSQASTQDSTFAVKTEPTLLEPPSPSIQLPVRTHKLIAPMPLSKLKQEDEDGWATPSDEDEDDDFRPDLNEVDEDIASEYSGTSRSRSAVRPLSPQPPIKPIKITLNAGKSFQKQQGPQKKRVTARDKLELKKAAQKAARKETKRNGTARQLEPTSVNVKTNSPPLDLGMGIKTLYI